MANTDRYMWHRWVSYPANVPYKARVQLGVLSELLSSYPFSLDRFVAMSQLIDWGYDAGLITLKERLELRYVVGPEM